jgi:steroid delta-isomerase-like uncharacterized protein
MSANPRSEWEELVERDISIWNGGNPDAIDEVYAADATYTDPTGAVHDRDSYREYVEMIRTAFPDFHIEVQELLQSGDTVVTRYTYSGTMEGEYRGFEPTGKSFEHHGISWHRIEDGTIVEAWNVANQMAMAQQLGLLG